MIRGVRIDHFSFYLSIKINMHRQNLTFNISLLYKYLCKENVQEKSFSNILDVEVKVWVILEF